MLHHPKRLKYIHPKLVEVVKRAAELTEQEFAVHDGVRTPEKQKLLVASGASKTMNSKHLIQPDGYGHAVDLVPMIAGGLRWEWTPIFKIAQAMDVAATQLKMSEHIRWGGVWDKLLSEYGGSAESMKLEVDAYCVRHPGKDFIDGPHFELTGTLL